MMSETILTPSKQKNAVNHQAAATALLEQMARVEERMNLHQTEGERLKIETQVIKERTEGTLGQLQEQLNRLSTAA
jgi:hypothetical protein